MGAEAKKIVIMKDGLLWLSQVSAAVLLFHSEKILVAAMHVNAALIGGMVIGSTLFRRERRCNSMFILI